jgi:hypothetical protein
VFVLRRLVERLLERGLFGLELVDRRLVVG